MKHRKELTSSGFGSPLELSAGAGVVLKKMPLDTALRFIVFSGGPGEGPRTFWRKRKKMTEGRKVGWASKIEPGPLLSSKSGFIDWIKRTVDKN